MNFAGYNLEEVRKTYNPGTKVRTINLLEEKLRLEDFKPVHNLITSFENLGLEVELAARTLLDTKYRSVDLLVTGEAKIATRVENTLTASYQDKIVLSVGTNNYTVNNVVKGMTRKRNDVYAELKSGKTLINISMLKVTP